MRITRSESQPETQSPAQALEEMSNMGKGFGMAIHEPPLTDVPVLRQIQQAYRSLAEHLPLPRRMVHEPFEYEMETMNLVEYDDLMDLMDRLHGRIGHERVYIASAYLDAMKEIGDDFFHVDLQDVSIAEDNGVEAVRCRLQVLVHKDHKDMNPKPGPSFDVFFDLGDSVQVEKTFHFNDSRDDHFRFAMVVADREEVEATYKERAAEG